MISLDKPTAAKVNKVFNKLTAFALDNLMLDALDEMYTLNKLCSLVGIKPEKIDVDYGDATVDELLAELKTLVPSVDTAMVADMLMPLPHTVNYYFGDELSRNTKKAFGFLFELFGKTGEASGVGGYSRYVKSTADRSVFLPVGGDELKFSPISLGNCVATLSCPDFMSEDVTARLAAFAEKYGLAIAKVVGADDDYMCCENIAPAAAKVKKQLKDGAVKVNLLDYPAPALSVVGPKNSAAREAARIIKAATDENIPCVCACKTGEWTSFYIVFAGSVATSETIVASDALLPLGVAATVDFAPLMPILSKGTALPNDLAAFKQVYSVVGGVKHGDKAGAALDEAVAELVKKAIAGAASTREEKAIEIAQA